MSENEEKMISVDLTPDGQVVISAASTPDEFGNVELKDVRFPIESARKIADELYRMTGIALPVGSEKSPFE